MYSLIYRKYMHWMPQLGGRKADAPITKGVSVSSHKDKSATDYGNEYRGVGVLTGLLGIAIVFAAIAPSAFHIENLGLLKSFGVLKVFMMCLMLYLVYQIGHRSGLKNNWIHTRRDSEKYRYKVLSDLIQILKLSNQLQDAVKVKKELTRILKGDDGQIIYNHTKAEQYEAIEKAAERISWVSFFIALLCAAWLLLSEFDIVHHRPWLILGTAFLPALVGGIHGINGFLNVGGLVDDHKRMANYLRDADHSLEKSEAEEVGKVLDLASSIYSQLDGHDVEWMKKTQNGNKLIVG